MISVPLMCTNTLKAYQIQGCFLMSYLTVSYSCKDSHTSVSLVFYPPIIDAQTPPKVQFKVYAPCPKQGG